MTSPAPGAPLLQRDRALDRNDVDAVEVALAASGDTHAFERLYRTHVGRVYALVRRMLDDEDADEVTQDIFVYDIMGEDSNGMLIGRHRSTGITKPNFTERARYFNEEANLVEALEKANVEQREILGR